ncbi:MAG: hypothetical protein ACOYL6_05100 [Bacteriovoracaceae bacterium]
METLVMWSIYLGVNESGIPHFSGQFFYRGYWVKKISVMCLKDVEINQGDECLFWVEFLSLEADNMEVKYLKNFNQKLFFSQGQI